MPEPTKEHVDQIYERETYPGMSHPVADPSAMAASALFGGLRTPELATARILEIGCARGYHISPIAQRWPHAKVTALDISASAVDYARNAAISAGIKNVEFFCADLLEWNSKGETYDYIIAHGMFSWIDDACKTALLRMCRESLSQSGVAMLSYNALPGWALRQPLVQMTRALQHASDGSLMATLGLLDRALDGRSDAYGTYLHDLVRDLAKKGEEILTFDDFAPINDPFYLSQFVQLANQHGLRYVGESNMGVDEVASLTEGAIEFLPKLGADFLLQQQTQDLLTGRCFRTSLMCRDDASVSHPTVVEMMDLCLEVVEPIEPIGNATYDAIVDALKRISPGTIRLYRLSESLPEVTQKSLMGCVTRLIAMGLARVVKEEFLPDSTFPSHPSLSLLNQIYLRDSGIVVDRLHRPCKLSQAGRIALSTCDGQRSFETLLQEQEPNAKKGFESLLRHMHQRGIVV